MNILLVSGLFSTAESYGKGTATAEIIIMLLVAFILGYLLRYFIEKKRNEEFDKKCEKLQQKIKDIESELKKMTDKKNDKTLSNKLSVKNEDTNEVVDNSNAQAAVGIVEIPAQKDPSVRDDLKKIEGIGPKIEQLLYAEEIYTWNDLAQTEVKIIQAILDKAGPRYKVHNPESWPFQAEMAAKGEWEKLEKWQDEHKGGRF